MLLAGLGCAQSRGPRRTEVPVERTAEERHKRPSDGLFRPDKIFAILERSPRTYEIASAHDVERSELPEVMPALRGQARPIDPYLEVKLDEDDHVRLESSRPPPEIADVFERAGQAFAARDYHAAEALYAKAIKEEPTYFKSYTYIGNVYYFLRDLTRAEAAFTRAIELNPVDYQAHLFLGDTYFQMGEFVRAKESLTRAFMLNRTNEVVIERLRATLAKVDLRVRSHRLSPRIRIERAGENVVLHFDKSGGLRWLALSACLACWTFESECGDRADEDVDPLRLSMYRECLINQAASIAVRAGKEDEEISNDEALLLGAIEDGYLEAIIFWEIVASRAPVVIMLLPEPVKGQIFEYIDRYVFESTRLI